MTLVYLILIHHKKLKSPKTLNSQTKAKSYHQSNSCKEKQKGNRPFFSPAKRRATGTLKITNSFINKNSKNVKQ
jgi:hypothetical protein